MEIGNRQEGRGKAVGGPVAWASTMVRGVPCDGWTAVLDCETVQKLSLFVHV